MLLAIKGRTPVFLAVKGATVEATIMPLCGLCDAFKFKIFPLNLFLSLLQKCQVDI